MKSRPATQSGWWRLFASFLFAGTTTGFAAEAVSRTIDYDRDVRPIFEAACFQCHGPERPKSRYRLDNATSALKGGSLNTNDIVPFKSAESLLIDYVSGRDEEMLMPPAGKGTPLTAGQIAILRDWIDQGARWSAASLVPSRPESLSVTPVVGSIQVSGNKQKFRADTGQTDGFVIGFQDFELKEPVGKESELVATGRAIFEQQDYRIGMTLTTPDLGFVDGGYSTYRKYFNDVGGYYAPFGLSSAQLSQPPFVLNQDLFVDNQRAWISLGLTLPELPRIVVGYEYLSRSGQESTLNWSQYSTNPAATFGKAILPSYRNTTERTHVVKLDASYEAGGYLLENNFRGEFYQLDQSTATPGGSFNLTGTSALDQTYDHFQAVNVFRVEKQYRPWLFVSGGALYTHLNGDASLDHTAGSILSPITELTQGQGITLKQTSHTINGNAQLGPWEGLTLSLGVQADWEKREGGGTVLVPALGANVQENFNRDRTAVEEVAVLRYTKIPFTVLYAEARLAQEWYDLYEGGYDDSLSEFMRDSDSTVNHQTYRAGFSVSPWQPVSFDASYQYHNRRNSYDNTVLTVLPPPDPPILITDSYPGFLRWLQSTGDEVEARLTLRPCRWLKTTLKYQWTQIEYRNSVLSNNVLFPRPPPLPPFPPQSIAFPGGELLTGDTEANTYSINVTLTPVRRLYLTTSFSYSDTRTVSGINNYPGVAPSIVAPYEGDIYSVLASANYSLNKLTDLNAAYSFSRANYRQDNLNGLPLGIVYDRNAVLIGLTRRFTRNLTGRLQYAFTTYNEPSSAQVNNYRANAVLCSLNIRLP